MRLELFLKRWVSGFPLHRISIRVIFVEMNTFESFFSLKHAFPYRTNISLKIFYGLHFLATKYLLTHHSSIAQSAGAIEYTDYSSAKGWDPTSNECPGYDTKQSDSEVPVMLSLWWMTSTPSLPLLPGPLWPDVVAPDWTNCTLMLNWIVWLNWIAWNRNVFDN